MKNFLGYLLGIAVAVMLTIEISGSGGIFIISLLIIALIFSLIIMLISSRSVRAGLELSAGIVGKYDDITANISVSKATVLPTCFVDITLGFTPNIRSENDKLTYRFIFTKSEGETIKIPLYAELCGGADVYVSEIVLTDYLGIFKKRIKQLPEKCELRIIPRIPDAGSQSEIIRSSSQAISFDDSDEESDETSAALTGFPGYEHRQYFPGDPLKRVNWKLSSKKEELMVRLDEKVTSSSQIFQLDLPEWGSGEDLLKYYENFDKTIEAALSMQSMLLLSGFEGEFNYFLDGWESIAVKDEKDLLYLQERLAGIRPYPPESRLPEHNINPKSKAMICFTSCMLGMEKEAAVISDGYTGSFVVTAFGGIGKLNGETWEVNDDFEFSRIQ